MSHISLSALGKILDTCSRCHVNSANSISVLPTWYPPGEQNGVELPNHQSGDIKSICFCVSRLYNGGKVALLDIEILDEAWYKLANSSDEEREDVCVRIGVEECEDILDLKEHVVDVGGMIGHFLAEILEIVSSSAAIDPRHQDSVFKCEVVCKKDIKGWPPISERAHAKEEMRSWKGRRSERSEHGIEISKLCAERVVRQDEEIKVPCGRVGGKLKVGGWQKVWGGRRGGTLKDRGRGRGRGEKGAREGVGGVRGEV